MARRLTSVLSHMRSEMPFASSLRAFSTASCTRPLEGRVALVTGSTSGIGLGIAKVLASKGSNIVLNGFVDSESQLTEIKKQISNFNVKVIYNNADVSRPEQIRAMVAQAHDTFGALDILVNNAGIQFVSPIENFPEEKWDKIISINMNSVYHAIKAALPKMKERKFGRIINISSVHGLVGSAGKSAYVTSKHGVVGMTKVVALETAGTGITANCINPGWVLTPLVEKQIRDRAAAQKIPYEEAVVGLLSEKQPSKQFVKPEELGAVAAFLSTLEAGQITGISIPVDGAWTAQ